MKPSRNTVNPNSDSYSSCDSDNSLPSRISQTSPPFETKDINYCNKHSHENSLKHGDTQNSDDDYETTDASDNSVEIDVNAPSNKSNKSAIIQPSRDKTHVVNTRQINTSKSLVSKNIPLYYLQKENFDNRFKSVQKQNNLNVMKQSGQQMKMYNIESENSDNDDLQLTNRTAKNRPKSRVGQRDDQTNAETSPPPKESSFLSIIPPNSARPKTSKRPPTKYTGRHVSANVNSLKKPNTAKEVCKLNLPDIESDESESEKEDQQILSPFRGPLPGEYDPEKFNYLDVSDEIKDLFLNIIRYAPLHINLDLKFKAFIPDYIPSVGDVDAFIKINAPENLPSFTSTKKIDFPELGINILDEPSRYQSDPALLHLHLRATTSTTKKTDESNLIIKKVSNVEKNASTIDKWIEDVSKLHLTQPSVKFTYGHPMPPLELLLQPWPPNFEMLLQKNGFPSPKLKCSLSEYIDLTCTMLDIPVYDKKIESLHLLFSLFLATKKSDICDNTELKDIHDITEDYLNINC